MNYPRASSFNFTVSPQAIDEFRRSGRAILLSVRDESDPILDWKAYEPASGERPRCVEGDISFYFDDITAPLLEGMTVAVFGIGTSPKFARSNARIHATWTA